MVGVSNFLLRIHHQSRTVNIVGSALGADVDQRTLGVADTGVVHGGLHLEFADGGLRRRERHAHLRAVGERVGHAVDGELVVVGAAAVGGKLRRSVVERRLAQAHVGGVDRARRHQFELHGVAGEQGQFEHAPLVHHLAERGVGGGEQRRGAGDFHLFGDVADLHLHIHFNVVVDAHLHVFAHEFLEAGGFRADIVEAGNQEGQGIVARLVGFGGYRQAGSDVDGFDFGGWHYRAGRIGDASQDGTARFLGVHVMANNSGTRAARTYTFLLICTPIIETSDTRLLYRARSATRSQALSSPGRPRRTANFKIYRSYYAGYGDLAGVIIEYDVGL